MKLVVGEGGSILYAKTKQTKKKQLKTFAMYFGKSTEFLKKLLISKIPSYFKDKTL